MTRTAERRSVRSSFVQRSEVGRDLQLELGQLVALGGGLGPNAAAGRVGIGPDEGLIGAAVERGLGAGIRAGHGGVAEEVVGHVPALCMP